MRTSTRGCPASGVQPSSEWTAGCGWVARTPPETLNTGACPSCDLPCFDVLSFLTHLAFEPYDPTKGASEEGLDERYERLQSLAAARPAGQAVPEALEVMQLYFRYAAAPEAKVALKAAALLPRATRRALLPAVEVLRGRLRHDPNLPGWCTAFVRDAMEG